MKTFWILFKFSGKCPGFTTFIVAASLAAGVESLGLRLADVEEWRDVTDNPPR